MRLEVVELVVLADCDFDCGVHYAADRARLGRHAAVVSLDEALEPGLEGFAYPSLMLRLIAKAVPSAVGPVKKLIRRVWRHSGHRAAHWR